MSSQYLIGEETPQVPPYDAAGISQGMLIALAAFLFPLRHSLDERLDKRKVAHVPGVHHGHLALL